MTTVLNPRSQYWLLIGIGLAVSIVAIVMEFLRLIPVAGLVYLISLAALFAILSMYLPNVTRLRMGPVALEKQSAAIGPSSPPRFVDLSGRRR